MVGQQINFYIVCTDAFAADVSAVDFGYFCARVPVLIFGRAPGYPIFIKLPKNLTIKVQFFPRREKAKVGGSPYKRVQQNQNLFF